MIVQRVRQSRHTVVLHPNPPPTWEEGIRGRTRNNQLLPLAVEAIVSLLCILYPVGKSIVTLCARRIP